jgi:hypothetical protein
MTARQWVTRILAPGLLLWIILWACNTPSFPLPPPTPEALSFEQVGTGMVVLHIDPNDRIPPSAVVTVKNIDTQQFVGGPADADGSFDSPPFAGSDGDQIQLSFASDDGQGGSLCVILGNYGAEPMETRCEE